MLFGTALPVFAVLSTEPWVRVSYLSFLFHTIPVVSLSVAILVFLKRHGWVRPVDIPILNWEVGLFQIIRWPWVVYGSLMGVMMAIRRRPVVFRVTPKGTQHPISLSWRILLPYVLVVISSFLPALLVEDAGDAKGYYFFLILSQIIYVTALFSIVLIHFHEVANNR